MNGAPKCRNNNHREMGAYALIAKKEEDINTRLEVFLQVYQGPRYSPWVLLMGK